MSSVLRQMHQRGLVVAAAGIFLGTLSQAHMLVASQYGMQSRLPVEQELAAAAVPPSGRGDIEARLISGHNSIHIDRSHSLESRTYIIAAATGYGLEDCLGEGGECGGVVANAWCETYGHGSALKYGQAGEDFDATSKVSSSAPGAYFVTCGD